GRGVADPGDHQGGSREEVGPAGLLGQPGRHLAAGHAGLDVPGREFSPARRPEGDRVHRTAAGRGPVTAARPGPDRALPGPRRARHRRAERERERAMTTTAPVMPTAGQWKVDVEHSTATFT